MRSIHAVPVLGLVLLTAALSGCTGSLSPPKKYKDGIPRRALVYYKTSTCTTQAGQPVPGPADEYYFTRVSGNLRLLKLDRYGVGDMYDKFFVDENGYNFVALERWERPRKAYQFIIPASPEADAIRFEFAELGYTVVREGGASRIKGTPVARCTLVAQAESEPVPVPAEVERSSCDCVPGRALSCIGPGGCKGGQACLSNGSGFGPCDCGPVPAAAEAEPEIAPPVEQDH